MKALMSVAALAGVIGLLLLVGMIFDIIPSNTVKLLEGYMPVQMLAELAEDSAGILISNGIFFFATTPETGADLLSLGCHVITGGNHTWKHREYHAYLLSEPRALRPYNYPADAPGRGAATIGNTSS